MTRTNENHTGMWVPDESDLIERLDRLAEEMDVSRSKLMRSACWMYIDVEEALATDAGLEFDSERAKRAHVRQCVLDEIRRNRDG